jgi:hypothetical protein
LQHIEKPNRTKEAPMKIPLTFKCPDVVTYAMSDALGPTPEDPTEEEEIAREDLQEEIKAACEIWIKHSEYLTVEIDTEKNTCTPIKV